MLAALSRCVPRAEWWRFPVRPETLLRWHRDARPAQVGGLRPAPLVPAGPPLAPELRELILRLARENPRWGYQRVRGELLKLGHTVSATAIRTRPPAPRVPPAPRRAGLAWPAFLRAHAAGLLACDFFTVETVRLQVLYVLFFLDVGPGGCSSPAARRTRPAAWVTQQARNLTWDAGRGWRPADGARSTIGTPSSARRSTPSSPARASGWSARRCGPHGPTRSPSGGWARCAASAWTGCWC